MHALFRIGKMGAVTPSQPAEPGTPSASGAPPAAAASGALAAGTESALGASDGDQVTDGDPVTVGDMTAPVPEPDPEPEPEPEPKPQPKPIANPPYAVLDRGGGEALLVPKIGPGSMLGLRVVARIPGPRNQDVWDTRDLSPDGVIEWQPDRAALARAAAAYIEAAGREDASLSNAIRSRWTISWELFGRHGTVQHGSYPLQAVDLR